MTAVPAVQPTARQVKIGARATYVVYAGLGFSGSTWASRLPQVSARMHLDPASLGLLLLVIAVGGVVVLPLSGPLVARIGPRRMITAVALLVGVSLGAVALGYARSCTPMLIAGLYLLGTATGLWDVAMAVHAATVEYELDRSIDRSCRGFSPRSASAPSWAHPSAWSWPPGTSQYPCISRWSLSPSRR